MRHDVHIEAIDLIFIVFLASLYSRSNSPTRRHPPTQRTPPRPVAIDLGTRRWSGYGRQFG